MYRIILQECDADPTGESADKAQQLLTYYELDLGLNHVVRKYSEPLEEHANFLISGIVFNLSVKISCLFDY
jgi:hypothetical protein